MAEARAFKMIPHCTKDTITYEMDELIRCKDCKWHEMRGEMLICKAQDKPHTYDWFCADGAKDINVLDKEGR